MRLLLVAHRFPPDDETGRAAAFGRLASHLGERHEISLVCGYHRERSLVPSGALGVDLRGRTGLDAQLAVWRAARLAARRFDPEVVITSGAWIVPTRAPTVAVVRDLVGTGWDRPTGGMRRVLRLGLQRFDRIVVPSWASWQELRAAGAREWQVDRVPDVIDLPEPTAPPAQPPLVLVHPGRIHPSKGQHLSVDAVSRLSGAEKAAVELHVVGPVGDARYLDQLRVAARGQAIHFHAERADVTAWIQRAGLVLYPTCVAEGFADVAAVAQAYGRAVIFGDFPGVRESLGGVGRPVPPGDVEALRAAIRRALSDGETLAALGQEGRASVAARCAWPVVQRRWEEILTAAIHARS